MAIAKAEQVLSCSDTIRVKVIAMEEKKNLQQWRKTVMISRIHD